LAKRKQGESKAKSEKAPRRQQGEKKQSQEKPKGPVNKHSTRKAVSRKIIKHQRHIWDTYFAIRLYFHGLHNLPMAASERLPKQI